MKIILLILVLSLSGCSKEPETPVKITENIVNFPGPFEMFLNANDKNNEIIVLTDKFNADRVLYNARIKRALVFMKKEEYEKASAEFEQLLTENTTIEQKIQFLYNLQQCYLKMNNIGAFREVLKEYYSYLAQDIQEKSSVQ